jgi:RHS repeat-associated protein
VFFQYFLRISPKSSDKLTVISEMTSTTNPYSETTALAYDNADRLTQQTAGDGSVTAFAYDSANRQTDVWHQTGTGTTLERNQYTYDPVGNVTERDDSDGSATTFGYDSADQLTSETRGTPNAYTATYTYDDNGNRLSKTLGGVTTSYAYDNHDKLLSAGSKTYGYNNAGDCTGITVGGVTTTLSYDYEHRLTAVGGTATDSFSYNGLGLRVGKTDSTGTYSYVCDGTEAASPVLTDGAAVYTPGLSERRGSTSKFTHADALGSTRLLTDASQSATDTLAFDAFGMTTARTGSTPTPFGFVGEGQYQTDADTGLMLLGHRYYDASTGRFLSADPAQAGTNWYDYCDNNPLDRADPSGYDPGYSFGN